MTVSRTRLRRSGSLPAGSGANAGLGGSLNIASGDGTPGVVHMDAVVRCCPARILDTYFRGAPSV